MREFHVSEHFVKRVAERIGPTCDGRWLSRRIQQSVLNDDGWASYKTRQFEGRRVFRVLIDEGEFFIVVSDGGVPITVLPPGSVIKCGQKGNKRKRLRAVGWERFARRR